MSTSAVNDSPGSTAVQLVKSSSLKPGTSFKVALGQGFRNHLLPTPKARRLRGLGDKPRVNKGLPPANQLSVGRRSLLKGCPHRQATGAGKR
jgi:hypothetical protein